MNRLKTSLSDAWSLAMPYWRSEERRRALVMLCTLVLLNLALVGTTVLFTFWQGAFYNALEAKDWRGFLGSLLWWTDTPKDGFAVGFAPTLAIFVFATAYELYLRQALEISWRRWMTHNLVEGWLSDRAYFRIPFTDIGADNPDQRISEDIRLFIENGLLLGLGLIRSTASLLCFVFLLWTLSEPVKIHGIIVHGYLVWIALAYACAGTWFAHRVGRRLIPLHFVQQKAEADFRFSLMRLVENSEGIAFHRGEPEQERELNFRFAALVDNWRSLMSVTLRLTFFTTSYAQIVLVFPLLVVAPAYFAGRMSLGGIFQTSNAFAQVQTALSWFVQSYSDLTGWFATVQRLAGFRSAIEKVRSTCDGPTIVTDGGEELHVPGLTVTLPDGRPLLRDVKLRLKHGEWLLIQGPSGAGKSTLLRTMAGIWPFGVGSVRQPTGLILFLPQRPYMPLGTLKHAVCYPRNDEHFSNKDVTLVLASVGLGHLTSALAEIDTWERRLSGGEQQRITFARALLNRPDWLFLDEPTSALDPTAEDSLYTLLHEQLPGAAVISVSHSSYANRFHRRIISIEDGILREGIPNDAVEQTTGISGSINL